MGSLYIVEVEGFFSEIQFWSMTRAIRSTEVKGYAESIRNQSSVPLAIKSYQEKLRGVSFQKKQQQQFF